MVYLSKISFAESRESIRFCSNKVVSDFDFGYFLKKLFNASIFERISREDGALLDYDFPFLSYNFGPSLLAFILFGCPTTLILSPILEHSVA